MQSSQLGRSGRQRLRPSVVSRSRLLLLGLHDKSLVNVGDNTTAGNCSLDQGVELLVTADGQLKVARCYAFNLKVLARVASEFKHLSSQVLKNSGGVHCGSGTNSAVGTDTSLQESVNTTDGELDETNRHTSSYILSFFIFLK